MSRRILVVEDDPDTRDYLAKALRETGFTVEATASGREGLMHAIGGGSTGCCPTSTACRC